MLSAAGKTIEFLCYGVRRVDILESPHPPHLKLFISYIILRRIK